MPAAATAFEHENVCKICGTSIRPDRKYCGSCAATFQSEQIREAARSAGTVTAHSAQARGLRSESNATAGLREIGVGSIQPPGLADS
jgi:hypothetical protein